MIAKKLTLTLALSWCAAATVAGAEGYFRPVSFDVARKLAEKDHKLLFIDFYTTWCAPCKLMDRTTFADPWVVKWLTEKAVALKIDAEGDVKLADRFRIEFYPTLVFLKPDGKEFERMVGFVTAEEFRKIATDLEKGVTQLERARRQVQVDPGNPFAHFDLARALTTKGKYEEAFKEYLWCLDRGGDGPAEFKEIRDSYLIEEFAQLGDLYEPARQEMLRRRAAAEKRIQQIKGTDADVALYAAVNASTGETLRTLQTFDALLAREPTAEVAKALRPHVFELLLEAGRYADIARTTDISGEVDRVLRAASAEAPAAKGEAVQPEEIRQMLRLGAVAELARYYQALLGLGRTREARDVATKTLALDDSAETYNALAWAAYLSGKPQPENLEQARRALELAGGDSVMILDTVVRVMHLLGQTEQAIKECENALAKAETEQDKSILRQCLAEFRATGTH